MKDTMLRAAVLSRRLLLATVLAFGLAMMHGGIGQAVACTGMTNMAAMDMAPLPAAGGAMADSQHGMAAQHPQHHQPSHDPVSAHSSSMCVSTAALSSGGATKSGPATVVATPLAYAGQPQHAVAVSRATGREPPAPDVVSVLSVNRR